MPYAVLESSVALTLDDQSTVRETDREISCADSAVQVTGQIVPQGCEPFVGFRRAGGGKSRLKLEIDKQSHGVARDGRLRALKRGGGGWQLR